MSDPLFAAPPSGFYGPQQQQGYQFVGLVPSDHHPVAHHGGSEFQQMSYGYPSPSMMHMQTHPPFAAAHNPYTSAPYTSAVPAQAPASTALQQTSAAAAYFASPPQSASPDAASQRSQPLSRTPPTKYPMAAPPLSLTPQSQQNATASDAAVSTPRSPQSPGGQSREAARVTLLISINHDLIEEVERLRDEGKGGATSAQQVQQLRNEGKPDTMASEEYIQSLRRLQTNFAYLMPKAQIATGQATGTEAKQLPGPPIMTPPPHMPQGMKDKYEQLKELFPGWQGLDQRMAAQQQNMSPRPGGPARGANGAGTMSNSTTPTA